NCSARSSRCLASQRTPFACHGRQKFTSNCVLNVRKVGQVHGHTPLRRGSETILLITHACGRLSLLSAVPVRNAASAHCSRVDGFRESARNICARACGLLAPRDLDLSTILCLAHRKWKQTESVSGQNRIARCEMIEPDPSIANPDHTWWHVVGDMCPRPELPPLIVNLDRITAGQLSRISVDPGYPKAS